MPSKYDSLVSWARCHGAIIPESLSFPSKPQGHCITTSSIEKSTQVFHIPHEILITPARATAALPALENSSVHERMCAFIALEKRKEDGFWKAYFDAVPETFTTPSYFTKEEVAGLKGTNLFYAWRDRVDVWKDEFERVNALIPELNWEEYLWAATVLSSRSFPSRLASKNPDDVDPAMSDPILIPIMDMLNHRPNHPVTWLASENTITYIAETDYSAGDEIFNNYGAKCNEELLIGYGFALEDNPHDSVSLRLPAELDPTLYSLTRFDPLPPALVARFRRWILSPREILTPFEGKRAEYDGYAGLLRALSSKMIDLAGDIAVPTEAGRYASIYRKGQRDLYILAYDATKREMDKIKELTRMISARSLPGERTKRRRVEDQLHYSMVRWLCAQFQRENIQNEVGRHTQFKEYVIRLKREFYDRVDWVEWESVECDEPDPHPKDMYKRFRKDHIDVSLETVQMAWRLWMDEHVEINVYPDTKEAFETFADDKEVLMAALLGEEVDQGIFVEEMPDVDRVWTARDIQDIRRTRMSRQRN